MANNTQLSAPIGTGDNIIDVDMDSFSSYPSSGGKLPQSGIYVSANTSTKPTPVTATNGLYVQPGTATSWAVTGTFFQATQPVSIASTVTISGAVTNAGTFAVQAAQTGTWNVTVNTALPAGSNVIGHVIADSGSTTAVTGNVTVVQATGTNLHAVVDSGTITTVSAVTAITNALPAGSNVIGHVIADSGSTTVVTGNVTVVQGTGTSLHTVVDSGTITTVSAVTAITNALPAGSNVIGHVIADSGSTTVVTGTVAVTESGTWTVQPGNTPNTSPWLVSDTAATAGGTSIYSFLSTSAVQAAVVKASPGQVYALHFFNINATPVYVRLYNQTGTPGTGDTVVYRAIVPGNTAGAGYVVALPPGVAFSTGIGVRCTNAVADNDNTSLAANTVAGNVFYK